MITIAAERESVLADPFDPPGAFLFIAARSH
jgi:hypothetical protein